MPSLKSLNPAWPHFLGIFAVGLACLLGSFRWAFNGWSDPIQCNSLLNEGSWLDSNYKNWQPDGCVLHSYNEKEASKCLQSKDVIFIGDSVTRKLFFQVAKLLDATLGKVPLDEFKKHSDHNLHTKYGTNLTFAWDPFLNSTYTQWILTEARLAGVSREDPAPAPAMLVLGSGLWYLRYANTSGGISAWESRMEYIFASLAKDPKPADEVILLPVEQVITSKLSPDRASTIHPSDIEAMNSDLFHRINPPPENYRDIFKSPSIPSPVSLPLVFNKMVDETLTEDGLHYSDSLLRIQASILMNLRCNDVMPKTFPLSNTCCNRYPMPSLPHWIVLMVVLIYGPYIFYRVLKTGFGGFQAALLGQQSLSPLIISISIALIYLADRTGLWQKEQKQFDTWTFGLLCLLSLAVGLATVKRSDKDLGFLNRDQTDEWKGWMQIAILIYHYFGASKISGIYNPVRVLVASYLFMTGYGHTTFYLKKADFGFMRIAQVLIRLNLFTILLAYTMNTDYISYYFAPLVSMWYIVLYLTLVIGARFNDRLPLLLCKIFLSAGLMTWFFNESWLLEGLFEFLRRFCAIHWSSREWSFRVNLDLWIVYIGMLAAIAMLRIREYRLTDHPRWPLAVKMSIGASVVVMVWFFTFELFQESKFTYNKWHPYISFLPVLAFVVLRNSSVILRSASSQAFGFIGRCSLETFIVQFHFWLAGDSKAVLLVVPGTRWRPINFIVTSIMFIYLCDRIAFATGDITNRICGARARELPPPTTAALSNRTTRVSTSEGQEVTILLQPLIATSKDEAGNPIPMEPDTPIRPRRWVDRLVDDSSQSSDPSAIQRWFAERGGTLRLNARVTIFLVVLWLFNIFWPYPSDTVS